MLPEHLLRLLVLYIWVQIINFWKFFVALLRSFSHVSDKIHAWAQLINHQIWEHHKVIIFDELFDFLNSLFKFLNFTGHLLTSSNPGVNCDQRNQFLPKQRQALECFFFLKAVDLIG